MTNIPAAVPIILADGSLHRWATNAKYPDAAHDSDVADLITRYHAAGDWTDEHAAEAEWNVLEREFAVLRCRRYPALADYPSLRNMKVEWVPAGTPFTIVLSWRDCYLDEWRDCYLDEVLVTPSRLTRTATAQVR